RRQHPDAILAQQRRPLAALRNRVDPDREKPVFALRQRRFPLFAQQHQPQPREHSNNKDRCEILHHLAPFRRPRGSSATTSMISPRRMPASTIRDSAARTLRRSSSGGGRFSSLVRRAVTTAPDPCFMATSPASCNKR